MYKVYQFPGKPYRNEKVSWLYSRKPFFFDPILLFDKLMIVAFSIGFYNS